MHSEHSPLIDAFGFHHVLEIHDDHIVLDQHPVLAVRQAETVIFVTTDRQEIVCTPEACWYAVAGSTVAPTAAEAGQLLASNLAYWNDTLRLQALTQSLFRLVGEQAPVLLLPQPRLDPFIEGALARLPREASLTRVMALAQVIDQPLALVMTWLHQRGKTVQVPEQQPSADTAEEEEAPNTEALPTLVSAKRSMFRWTPEMVKTLITEFLASPLEESISATARTIAGQHDWPANKVEYKIHQIGLPEQRQEHRRPDASVAVPVLEQGQDVSSEPVMQESSGAAELHTGNYVWDGHVDGKKKRWYLDYPYYGEFPVKQGAQVFYRDCTYILHMIGAGTFTASTVGVPLESQEEEVSHVV